MTEKIIILSNKERVPTLLDRLLFVINYVSLKNILNE